MTRILAASVGVNDEARLWTAQHNGLLEGRHTQGRFHVCLGSPADNLLGVQVNEDDEIQEAAVCVNVSDVGDPDLIGATWFERSSQMVFRDGLIVI